MIRIAIAQIRPVKADYEANVRRIGGVFAGFRNVETAPDIVVFSECAMSAYYIEGGVREVAVTAGTLFKDLLAQHALSRAEPVDVVVGFYEEFRNNYFNSAIYATLGGADSRILHVHRKVFLPTYGLFDEARYVQHGDSVRAFDTKWGRAAILVCEDAWHSLTGTLAALDGAQLLVVPSAAPARGVAPRGRDDVEAPGRPASVIRWERLIQRMAAENGPDGEVLVSGPVFEEAMVTAELDLDAITRARVEEPLLADLEVQLSNLLGSQLRGSSPLSEYDDGDAVSGSSEPEEIPELELVEPERQDDPLAIDCELTKQWLVTFLQDEVRRRRKFEQVLVGLSGGVDSSLTAGLAARAFGPDNVIAVRMPYRSSSPDSMEHAKLVADQLGIRLITVDITGAVDGYLSAIDDDASPLRRGNVMARVRMITLFDLSARYQALPIGTGNKTERLMGYFTWHADDSPPVNPLGDLFKTQLIELARHVGVPEVILAKPATADLEEGQTDEGDLGVSYPKADRILHWLLKGLSHEHIVSLGFTEAEVSLVSNRLQGTHWKRRLPTVAMLSSTAIGESYLRPVDY
jgi:NAD+ synthetase